jgi:hypothetical protein
MLFFDLGIRFGDDTVLFRLPFAVGFTKLLRDPCGFFFILREEKLYSERSTADTP